MKYAFILILIIAFFAGIATTYKNAQEVNDMAKLLMKNGTRIYL